MRSTRILLLLTLLLALGCQAPVTLGESGRPVFRQGAIADIACGPSAIFNWMSHGGQELQGILTSLSTDRTPVQTVQHIIDTYGKRRSSTNPSVTRYGPHNGGVGSVNLMLMARELLSEHLDSPPTLRGEYLHRAEGESTEEHLQRVTEWFSESIESGIPVLFYLRGYRRTSGRAQPSNTFGHHVVVTSLDGEIGTTEGGTPRIGFTFVDSSSGRVERGDLFVAEQDFTAPTFTYRFDRDRALTTERVRTGRPLLEVRAPSYESAHPPRAEIIVAHFATFKKVPSVSAPPDR